MRPACALLLFLPPLAVASPLLRSEGIATHDDGSAAYRELHWQRGPADGPERWVQYLCPDGRPFARKHLPASPVPQRRGYALLDQRSGQRATVVVGNDAVQVAWTEHGGAAARTARVPLPAGAVIDAGFDAAVRQHWPALMRGDAVSLPFLVPGRQRFHAMRVQYRGSLRWQGQPARSFEVRLDAWFGAALPRLHLVYADTDRRLLEFRGISNLRDAQGDYPAVTVRFAEAAVEVPQQQWQAHWRRPLVSSCAAAAR